MKKLWNMRNSEKQKTKSVDELNQHEKNVEWKNQFILSRVETECVFIEIN